MKSSSHPTGGCHHRHQRQRLVLGGGGPWPGTLHRAAPGVEGALGQREERRSAAAPARRHHGQPRLLRQGTVPGDGANLLGTQLHVLIWKDLEDGIEAILGIMVVEGSDAFTIFHLFGGGNQNLAITWNNFLRP